MIHYAEAIKKKETFSICNGKYENKGKISWLTYGILTKY